MIKQALAFIHGSRRRRIGLLLLVSALAAASCAHQPAPIAGDVPGFFAGLVHGFLILFSFIASLVTDARIYAFPNSGGWYDFGFLLGAMAFLGGSGASSAGAASQPQP
jgi:hypothetical protein